MRSSLRFLTILVILAAVAVSAPVSSQVPEVKTRVADFTLEDVEGNKMNLNEHLKKGPVLLNFWTTWCKPCEKELPELSKLHEKYGDRFTLFSIAEDDQRTQAKVRPTVRSRGYTFPVLLDSDRRIGNLFSVRSYPTNVLIATDGTVAMTSLGYRKGDEKKLEAEIKKVLPPEAAKDEDEEAGDDS